MNRTKILPRLRVSRAGLLGVLLAGSCSSAEEPRANAGINVVVYIVDTLRADHLSCYGYERETSPSFDALARAGVLFENAHVQSNWTQPSVGSLITSLPPLRFGRFQKALPESVLTLAEVFKQHGYHTGGFTTTVAVAEEFGFSQGFDVYRESGSGLSMRDRAMRVGSDFDADRLFELQLPWLRAQAAAPEPFFLYLHSVDPHVPLTPPAEFDVFGEPYAGPIDGSVENLKPYKRRSDHPQADIDRLLALYDAEILFNDSVFGRLVDELERLGLTETTLIVVVSDHGEEFFERGAMEHGHRNLHRELTQVPWIMRLPGAIPAGLRVEALVAGVDLMPTVLSLVGIASPEWVTGRDLTALFRAEALAPAQTESFATRAKDDGDTGALRTAEWLLHVEPEEDDWQLYPVGPDGVEAAVDRWSELDPSAQDAWRERMERHANLQLGTERFFRASEADQGDRELSDELRQGLEALGYLGSED